MESNVVDVIISVKMTPTNLSLDAVISGWLYSHRGVMDRVGKARSIANMASVCSPAKASVNRRQMADDPLLLGQQGRQGSNTGVSKASSCHLHLAMRRRLRYSGSETKTIWPGGCHER